MGQSSIVKSQPRLVIVPPPVTSVGGDVTVSSAVVTTSALPAGASTEATLSAINVKLSDGNQKTQVTSSALPAGAATSTIQTDGTQKTQVTTFPSSASATIAGVSSSASTGVILASNANRKGAVIHNNSTAVLYLAFAATASIASGGYTHMLLPGEIYNMPNPVYAGVISGIWASANGYANVTEW